MHAWIVNREFYHRRVLEYFGELDAAAAKAYRNNTPENSSKPTAPAPGAHAKPNHDGARQKQTRTSEHKRPQTNPNSYLVNRESIFSK